MTAAQSLVKWLGGVFFWLFPSMQARFCGSCSEEKGDAHREGLGLCILLDGRGTKGKHRDRNLAVHGCNDCVPQRCS